MQLIKVHEKLLELARLTTYSDGQRTPILYMALVMMIQPTIAVEIGSFRGFSACCWAAGMREVGRGHLWSIEKNKKFTEIAKENIRALGLGKYVTMINGDGAGTITKTTKLQGMDFLFIDGDHNEEAVAKDITDTFRFVRPGGYILCHDFDTKYTQSGINRAFDEIEHSGHRIERMQFNVFAGGLLVRRVS